MTDYYNAFEMSPVPAPGPEAVAPEPFRGIYGMPAFVTIPTSDLAASADFWIRGLGFIEVFSVPGTLVHLRRWAFQDVHLVSAAGVPEQPPAMSFSFAGVLSQADSVARACRALRPDSVDGPRGTPWNTRDVDVITPENARIVFTAARPVVPASQEARNLGICRALRRHPRRAGHVVPPDDRRQRAPTASTPAPRRGSSARVPGCGPGERRPCARQRLAAGARRRPSERWPCRAQRARADGDGTPRSAGPVPRPLPGATGLA